MEPIILKHKDKDGNTVETSYVMVKDRIREFRKDHPLWSLITNLEKMEAGNVVFSARISDETSRVLATGFAWEQVNASYINKTSAVENCETSAIGRALANLGYLGDGEYASFDELQKIIDTDTKDYLFDLLRNSTFDDERKVLYESDINNCTLDKVDKLFDLFNANQIPEEFTDNARQKDIIRKLNLKDHDGK
jgi:hypothetical protein